MTREVNDDLMACSIPAILKARKTATRFAALYHPLPRDDHPETMLSFQRQLRDTLIPLLAPLYQTAMINETKRS